MHLPETPGTPRSQRPAFGPTLRTSRRPLPSEAEVGWERAAYLALYERTR